MALVLLFALALSGAEPPAAPAVDQPAAADAPLASDVKTADPSAIKSNADGSVTEKVPTREELEDAIPEGAPQSDYEFVAWCHGALAGQIELDPIVEKDMDAIEGKAKAAKRRADDAEIAKEHKKYLALYEQALVAAEKASPTALHQKGVDAEVLGYKIWGPTRNKAAVWRMVDWGNWEVPPRCEKAAKRLYDSASLLGVALKSETPDAQPAADAPRPSEPAKDAPAAETPTPASDAGAPAKDATPPVVTQTQAKASPKATRKRTAKIPVSAAAPAPVPPAKDASETPPAPAADAPDPGKEAPPAPDAAPKPQDDGLRGPQ
jgi:hypothetical protein